MNSYDSLLHVVGEIYAAVGHPDRWTACLQSISELMQGTAANLLYHDYRDHRGTISASTVDPAANESYTRYFHSVDPWALSISPGSFTPEQVIVGDSVVPHRRMVQTEFYADFGKGFGLTRVIMGVIEASPDASNIGVISVNRSDALPAFDANAQRIFSTVVPHLRRALALHRQLATTGAERVALTDVLDRFRAAVVLLDQKHQIVLMNRAASQLAARRDGLSVEGRHVAGATPAATASLTAAVSSAVGSACGHAISIGNWRIGLPRSSSPHPLDVLVLPLAHATSGTPAVALFITDPSETPALPTQILADQYSLTPTEARVASALARGRSVKDISETLHLSEQTTRWYVKQVLAKTGTSSQAQVVRLLLSITAALVSTEDA